MCIAFPQGVTKRTVHSALWNWLAEDVQRLLFASAVLQLLMLAVLVWLKRGEVVLVGELDTTTAYAVGAVYGVGAAILFGLLMGHFPAWTGGALFHRLRGEAVFLLLTLGFAVYYSALWAGSATIAVLGIALALAAWLLVLAGLWVALRQARRAGWHERWLTAGVAVGLAGLLIFLAGHLAESLEWRVAGRCVGLWGFLVPVWLIVLRRFSRPA